ncbi:hypothetical protein L7F22_067356 [Adiantum nelumboides]|nr:hypothetical protein [Adiantum nelumboides]
MEQSCGFSLSQGKLHFDGRPILHDVPSYVKLSSFTSLNSGKVAPFLSSSSCGGAFIGLTADKPADTHTFSLGKLQNTRFASIFRFKVWWATQWVGNHGSNLQKETQILTLDTHTKAKGDGVNDYPYIVFVPIIEGSFRAALQPGINDYVDAFVESGSTRVCEKNFSSCVYVHASRDPFLLVKDAVKAIRAHLGTFKLLEEKVVPQIVSRFGWCTWDAFYLRVCPEGIWDGIKSLADGGVPPGFLVIDAGWQSIAWDPQDPSEDATEQVIAGDQMSCRLTRVSENGKFSSYIKGSLLQKKSNNQDITCDHTVNGVKKVILPALSDTTRDGRSKDPEQTVRTLSHSSDIVRDSASKCKDVRGNDHKDACGYDTHEKYVRTSCAMLDEENNKGIGECGCDDTIPGRASQGPNTGSSTTDAGKGVGGCVQRPCNCPNALNTSVNDGREAQMALSNGPSKNECVSDHGKKGLAALIDDLKTEFPSLKDVYVWHAATGYWGGVRPGVEDSLGATLVKPVLSPGVAETMPDLAVDRIIRSFTGLVPPENIFKFYNRLHSYLDQSGVSGVKIDVIQVLEMLGENYGGRVQLSKAYCDGLSESIRKNLGGNRVIASMEQTNDFMLLGTENVTLGRVGDDFWPEDSKGDPLLWLQGFHVAHCAYNSIWLGQFIHPDWDMFQTTHVCAEFHAASRAISGGPVYVSDKPGRHRFELLKKVVNPDGMVPCCQRFALPTRDCLFSDPMMDGVTVLKMRNLTKVGGLIRTFNCQGGGWSPQKRMTVPSEKPRSTCYTKVSPRDIEWPGMPKVSESFAIYSLKLDKISLVRWSESLAVKVEPLDYDIFTVCALRHLAGNVRFAPFGLVNMLNGAGTIEALDSMARKVMIKLHRTGTFCAYSNSQPRKCYLNCSLTEVSYSFLDGKISIEVPWVNDGTTVKLEF